MMTETANTHVQWATEDLAFVEAMANELEAYIVDSAVYRTLVVAGTTGNRKVTMSGGDLLARLNRLRASYQNLSPEQQSRFDASANKAQSTIYSLRTSFHDLLRRELKARHDQRNWNEDIRRASNQDKADSAELQNQQYIAAIQAELQ